MSGLSCEVSVPSAGWVSWAWNSLVWWLVLESVNLHGLLASHLGLLMCVPESGQEKEKVRMSKNTFDHLIAALALSLVSVKVKIVGSNQCLA